MWIGKICTLKSTLNESIFLVSFDEESKLKKNRKKCKAK